MLLIEVKNVLAAGQGRDDALLRNCETAGDDGKLYGSHETRAASERCCQTGVEGVACAGRIHR